MHQKRESNQSTRGTNVGLLKFEKKFIVSPKKFTFSIINNFLEAKEEIFKEAGLVVENLKSGIKLCSEASQTNEIFKEFELKIAKISEDFNKLFEKTSTLMESEMQLHERVSVSAN